MYELYTSGYTNEPDNGRDDYDTKVVARVATAEQRDAVIASFNQSFFKPGVGETRPRLKHRSLLTEYPVRLTWLVQFDTEDVDYAYCVGAGDDWHEDVSGDPINERDVRVYCFAENLEAAIARAKELREERYEVNMAVVHWLLDESRQDGTNGCIASVRDGRLRFKQNDTVRNLIAFTSLLELSKHKYINWYSISSLVVKTLRPELMR